VTWLCLLTGAAYSQPEARVYTDIYERLGLSAGYTLGRSRVELNGGYRVDHVPAVDYVEQVHGWTSFNLATQAMQNFSDNTWQENTATLTIRALFSGKIERKWLGLYYGAYMRCLMRSSSPDRDSWSAADRDFMDNNRMPVYKKYVNVFGGLIAGVRGRIACNFFWDASVGLKLVPWFYEYSRLDYNDGTEDRQSYVSVGYQYSAPGDSILQFGIGYKFVPKAD
jgi:hypothetical protein